MERTQIGDDPGAGKANRYVFVAPSESIPSALDRWRGLCLSAAAGAGRRPSDGECCRTGSAQRMMAP